MPARATEDIGQVRSKIGDRVALQGNMDPLVLLSTPDAIDKEVKRICESIGSEPGFIFNLGHGINKNTPVENVDAFVQAVHTYGNMK